MTLLDASAVLAWLQAEPGADLVDDALQRSEPPARVLATGWAEVLTIARRHGRDPDDVDGLLRAAGFHPVPVTDADARLAAWEWEPWLDLSLADRLCLVAPARLDPSPEQLLTADREWECASNLGGVTIVFLRPLEPRPARELASWLHEQEQRDDPVGDLARDAATDTSWPRRGQVTLASLLEHCIPLEPDDSAPGRALRRAWREWTRTLRP